MRMKHRFTIVASIVAFVAVGVVGTVQAQTIGNNETKERGSISVTFETPISVETIVDTLQKGGFDSASIRGSFTINNETIQDFITIFPGQKTNEVKANWRNGRGLIISKLKKDGHFHKNDTKSTLDNSDQFIVGDITIHGEKGSVQDIATRFQGSASEYRSSQPSENMITVPDGSASRSAQQAQSTLGGNMMTLAAVANAPYYTLVPVSGSVTTGLFTAPGVSGARRGVLNYMRWNTNGFASDQTYEHDFFLSSNNGTYFDRAFSSPATGCRPLVVYAATSWPSSARPFLDSDLESDGTCSNGANSGGNIAYSIIAAQANAITTGVDHFTAILMPDGDASTDTFILQGQVGYRNPVTEYGPLTSFPYGYLQKETTHYGLIYNGVVPGYRTWTFNGNVPDTPDTLSATNPTISSLRINFRDVTWDETSTVVERRVGISGAWSTVATFGTLNQGNSVGYWYWTDSTLARGTTYCYRMRTINAIGASPYSSVFCGMTTP